jgi:hypothetical protein
MRRLVLFLVIVTTLLGAVAAFDWWVDPFGDIYKPDALTAAMQQHPNCLVSQELVGARYFPFKLDIFHRRPTTRFVVGSSRVLKIKARPGERTFSNLGFPGSSPETILALFRELAAKPVQTVYVGVEANWFNSFVVPVYRPSRRQIAQYLLSRSTFESAFKFTREAPYILVDRWKREPVGRRCVIGRQSPAIAWNVDGSRTFNYELDPRVAKPSPPSYTADTFPYREWTTFDEPRLEVLRQALALARERGWRVIGFAPPEAAPVLHRLETDPQAAPLWREFLRRVSGVFRSEGYAWAGLWNGQALGCRPTDFPDGFHSDAGCSLRVRAELDRVAGR